MRDEGGSSMRGRAVVGFVAGVFLLVAASGLLATALHGQVPSGEVDSAFCWRGQALPGCRSFVIFELEGGLVVASTTVVHESAVLTSEHPAFQNELKWHVGAMRNLSPAWAVGATVSLGSGSPGPLTGIRLRARRWLRSPMSAELEAGAVFTGINRRFGSGSGWGPAIGLRLAAGDHASLFTRWEAAYARAGSDGRFSREAGFHQAMYVGASAGSTIAVAGSAVLGALVLVVAHALGEK
jgi:hypothetical protein